MTLRRAEWHRRRRKERARKRTAFLANTFGFTKQLLGQKRSGQLTCSKVDIDCHLDATLRDVSREQELDDCQSLIDPPAPTLDFDGREQAAERKAGTVEVCWAHNPKVDGCIHPLLTGNVLDQQSKMSLNF